MRPLDGQFVHFNSIHLDILNPTLDLYFYALPASLTPISTNSQKDSFSHQCLTAQHLPPLTLVVYSWNPSLRVAGIHSAAMDIFLLPLPRMMPAAHEDAREMGYQSPKFKNDDLVLTRFPCRNLTRHLPTT